RPHSCNVPPQRLLRRTLGPEQGSPESNMAGEGGREGPGSRTFLCRALGEAPAVSRPCVYHGRLAQSEVRGRFYSPGPDRRVSPEATCSRKESRMRLKTSGRSIISQWPVPRTTWTGRSGSRWWRL